MAGLADVQGLSVGFRVQAADGGVEDRPKSGTRTVQIWCERDHGLAPLGFQVVGERLLSPAVQRVSQLRVFV